MKGTKPIDGPRTLPTAYPHPHASDEARRIAEAGMILRAQVGSGLHGTSISGQDDRDEMGICLEPARLVTGISGVPRGPNSEGKHPFAQYQRHTVWDQPGGLANRSGAGDLDAVVYSARKWARLALGGNPTVLLLLFIPDEDVVLCTDAGVELMENAHRFVSRRAAGRFIGHLRSQRAAMTGEVGAHTNRPELVAEHGYDTKFAMHALRLGVQGEEFLRTGCISLPVAEPSLSFLRAVRRGEVPLDDVVRSIDDAEAQLRVLGDDEALPAEPDVAWVNDWLHRRHLEFWASGDGA